MMKELTAAAALRLEKKKGGSLPDCNRAVELFRAWEADPPEWATGSGEQWEFFNFLAFVYSTGKEDARREQLNLTKAE